MMTDGSKKAMSNRVKKEFEYTTLFLIFTSKIIIDLRYLTRVLSFFGFFGLSISSKMSVSEIKTTFLIFNSR